MKRVMLAVAVLAALGAGATARTIRPVKKPRENFLCKEAGVPIRYSLVGDTLLGYENGPRPNVYDVQKNTARLIVATRSLKKPRGVVTISIDRHIGGFTERFKVKTGYTENQSGYCKKVE
jgi:hypothetical protein